MADPYDRQPAVADYALLSDCHAPALVSRAGSIDWWCPPRADQPSVFGRLLDPGAGHWSLSASGPADVARHYIRDTFVLETIIRTADGHARVQDCLSLEPGARGHDIGYRAPQLLLRSITGLGGHVRMRCEFAPRIEYGLTAPHLEASPGVVVAEGGSVRLRLTTPVELSVDGGTASAEFTVDQGQRLTFALASAPLHGTHTSSDVDPDEALVDTVAGWQSWVGAHTPFEGPHAAAVQRSALALQALTCEPSGGVLAAATTPLPARMGGSDNWDALDRAVQPADVLQSDDAVGRWTQTAEQIRSTVLEEAWSPDIDAFAGAFGSDQLDASVLVMPLVGFIAADDERMLGTIRSIQRGLVRDGLVYRWDGDANSRPHRYRTRKRRNVWDSNERQPRLARGCSPARSAPPR